MLALFAVVVFDELGSGIAPASAGDVARDLKVPAGLLAGGMITAFHLLAMFIEAPLLAFSERLPLRWFSAASLAVLALVTLGAALAPGPLGLVVCLALYGPASGCALAASEGYLVESDPDQRARTLTRLNLAGALGDLSVPLLLAALAWTGHAWRVALMLAAGFAGALALAHGASRALERRIDMTESDDAADPAGVLEVLRLALSTRSLLAWSLAVALTSLLDEVLIAFAVVRLAHVSPLMRACAVGTWTVGLIGGLFALERWVDRLDGLALLRTSAGVVAAALVTLAWAENAYVASLALFVLGAGTSTLHPLAAARAYAALPGRPALVHAVASIFAPFDALSPLALGALALWLGPEAALLTLLVAPAGIALAAWRAR